MKDIVIINNHSTDVSKLVNKLKDSIKIADESINVHIRDADEPLRKYCKEYELSGISFLENYQYHKVNDFKRNNEIYNNFYLNNSYNGNKYTMEIFYNIPVYENIYGQNIFFILVEDDEINNDIKIKSYLEKLKIELDKDSRFKHAHLLEAIVTESEIIEQIDDEGNNKILYKPLFKSRSEIIKELKEDNSDFIVLKEDNITTPKNIFNILSKIT